MFSIHQKVHKILTENNKGWKDHCFQIPVLQTPKILRKRRKRSPNDDFFGEFDEWDSNTFEEE